MKNRLLLFINAVFLSTGLIFSFCFVLRSVAQAGSADRLKPARQDDAPSAALPDLDVTFIERQPMYFAYCVAYHWGEVPGMPVNGRTTTPTGHTLHLNPFGMVDIVGEHVTAQVIRDSEGILLRFSMHSAFAGKVLKFSMIMEQIHQQEASQKAVLRNPFRGVRAP